MTALLIVLACVVAYVAVGLKYAAPMYVTRAVNERIDMWSQDLLEWALKRDPDMIAKWRREETGCAFGVALVWPFYLAALGAKWMASVAIQDAPLTSYELKLQNDQQAQRIAELERELGIGRTS